MLPQIRNMALFESEVFAGLGSNPATGKLGLSLSLNYIQANLCDSSATWNK